MVIRQRDRRKRNARLDAGLQGRLIGRFVIAIALSSSIFTLGFVAYYWFAYIAGDNLFREFVVVYRQQERIEPVVVDDREIERRSYAAEALPQTTRWRLIIPPLILNNLLIAVVLSILAIRYSHNIAGPIYRMSTDIRRALTGARGVRIRLRRQDELKELAVRINDLLETLDASVGPSEDDEALSPATKKRTATEGDTPKLNV